MRDVFDLFVNSSATHAATDRTDSIERNGITESLNNSIDKYTIMVIISNAIVYELHQYFL